MTSKNRSSEDKDKHFQLMKNNHVTKSKAFTCSSVSKRRRTGKKAYAIKYVTMNKCFSLPIRRQFKVSQWKLYSLIDEIHIQLDSKSIEDSKDHLWRKKYSESAKVYMHDLYEVGRAEFVIDPTDLREEAKSVFYKLDDHSAEYVIREVIRRIIASISVRDFKLRLRDIISYSIGASKDG
jgi:hypothetical protein